MKKIIITILLLSTLLVVPKVYEYKIKSDAPKLLKINDFKIIKEGEFHILHQCVDYVVVKNGVIDTISVRLSHGSLSIQPN